MLLWVNWNILEIQNMKNCSKVLLLMGGKEYPVKMCRCQLIIENLTSHFHILEKFHGQSQSVFTNYEKTEQDWNIWKICYKIFNFFHISFHFLMTTSENPEEPLNLKPWRHDGGVKQYYIICMYPKYWIKITYL